MSHRIKNQESKERVRARDEKVSREGGKAGREIGSQILPGLSEAGEGGGKGVGEGGRGRGEG